MRAWQATKYGRPTEALELVDIPDPSPGPGEILVRTSTSMLNYNEADALSWSVPDDQPTAALHAWRGMCWRDRGRRHRSRGLGPPKLAGMRTSRTTALAYAKRMTANSLSGLKNHP